MSALPDRVRLVNPTPQRHIVVRVRDAAAAHPAVVRMLDLLDERVAADRRAA